MKAFRWPRPLSVASLRPTHFHINVVTGTNTSHRTVLLVRLPHPKGVAFFLWRRYSTGVDRDKIIIPTLQMIRSGFWEIVGLVQDLKPGTLTPSHSLIISQSRGKDFYSAQGKKWKGYSIHWLVTGKSVRKPSTSTTHVSPNHYKFYSPKFGREQQNHPLSQPNSLIATMISKTKPFFYNLKWT